MPISFGVLLLTLAVTLLLTSSVSWVVYRKAARADEASQASERRLAKEIAQLRAAAAALQAQLDMRAQDIATQSQELERMSSELEALRSRGSSDRRAIRRAERPSHAAP